ncbi:hypothetical protein [Brevundimonas sp.]|uniref:tyrosine-type recombinase/integrase n=1 Tax=Brevundimonas sp. TaxID=1871086 RepID=UPI0025BE3C84|nr:hypothetical protein [Brevundimonas sp.]
MKSQPFDLGAYVIVRKRKDGTHRVLFEVPARLRPAGWPATIALPIETPRTGNFERNPDEQLRVRADALTLNRQLAEARGQRVSVGSSRTLETLAQNWRRTGAYKALKPRTQRGYEQTLRYILDWSKECRHPDPTKLTKSVAEAFVSRFDDRPTTRRMVKVVFKMVMDQAIDLGWRSDNPVARIKAAAPKTRVAIWEQEDVDTYAWAALSIGQPDMAALIQLQWEIGQRLTDCYLFKYGEQYDAARATFSFEQEKTGSAVTFRISDRMRTMLETTRRAGKLYLFEDARFTRPWMRKVGSRIEADDIAGAKVFAQAREKALESGARDLKLKWLRHSCVVQLARAECTVPEIASITGHSITSVEQIMQKYLPRDSKVAENAQRKRGLVHRQSDDPQSDESDGSPVASAA